MNKNIFPHEHKVTRNDRSKLLGQRPIVIWFTGLSGSGKSTIAGALEEELSKRGFKTYLLDGDMLRTGLNKDLGFSDSERTENIRRTGEVCRLLHDAGLAVLAAFISPFRKDRQLVRELFGANEFIEIFVNAPLEVCMDRDPKGLYRKSKDGQVSSMTGIESAYETPLNPEIELRTDQDSVVDSVGKIIGKILPLMRA